MRREGRIVTKNQVQKAVEIEANIMISDSHQLKKHKIDLVSKVLKSLSAATEEKHSDAEGDIRAVLARYPRLSDYVAFLRFELVN